MRRCRSRNRSLRSTPALRGFLDSVEVNDVVRYEAALLSFLRSEHGDVLKTIRDSKQLDDDTAAKLKDALSTFGKQFA